MKSIKKWLIKGLIGISTVGSMIFFVGSGITGQGANLNKTDTADLRFIFTTDLHGQINSKDYETGLDYKNFGLARAYDLIMKAKTEVDRNNSFTFDVGDALYDYTTEYIFSMNQDEIQPIYKAMSMVGYDAITLGNHEFDYGWSYLLSQLEGSGLKDKVVLSNVVDSKTDEHPFHENMLITRSVKTDNGKKVDVKIGVIGETIPHLTAKTESYTGILKTEDIYTNVERQAKKLKEMGADIVVVLAHSGIGDENPEENFKNVSYSLSKIKEVDMILCGHEHRNFPTTDKSSPYLSLLGVDVETSLVNGKNLVMANDRGRSIGLVDLEIEIHGEDISIINRESSLRYVADEATIENKDIASVYGSWEDNFSRYADEVIGELSGNEVLQNYAGLIEDNASIQLINDAKRSHAIRYINNSAEKFVDYPIVSVSAYYSYGAKSATDFIHIKNKFTESDLALIQPYNNYLYLYEVTGAQLKEWIEWSASMYETSSDSLNWNDSAMKELSKLTNTKPFVKENWFTSWNYFYIFDGIEYTIDSSKEARYDFSGNKVSNSNRVSNISYNGKAITDSSKLILASNKITGPTEANKGIENQYIYKNFYRTQSVLSEYIQTISKVGSILPTPDNNWNVIGTKEFLIKVPSIGKEEVKNSPWYMQELKTVDGYTYLKGQSIERHNDSIAPNLYLVPTITEVTGTGYDVIVDAIDSSGIKELRYKEGKYNLSYNDWYNEKEVKHSLSVKVNGIYSVFAEDNHGNKVVKQIVIDNISDLVIATPKLETYTNRKTSIKGNAEANAIIVISASTGTYETTTKKDGSFTYSLPAQPSGSKVLVYAKDEKTGRISNPVSQTVKRTGPNQPKLEPVYNNSIAITGLVNDNDANVIAIVEGTVYVNRNGGKEQYESLKEIYDKAYYIVETDIIIEDGKYLIEIPYQRTGVEVTIYNVDHLNRLSRKNSTVVSENGPDIPTVNQVTNIENIIRGKVTSSVKNSKFTVRAELNGRVYSSSTDSKGNFEIMVNEQLIGGQIIYVYASDIKNNKVRVSGILPVVVDSIASLNESGNGEITINPMNNKELIISGTYELGASKIYVGIDGLEHSQLEEVITDENGNYSLVIPYPLESGTQIYALAKFDNGEVYAISKQQVSLSVPDKPMLIEAMNNSHKTVQVVTDKDSIVTIKIGNKKYRAKDYYYEEEGNRYIYTVEIGRFDSDTTYKIYAKNEAGYSEVIKGKIEKLAPNAPLVHELTSKDKVITGKIELLDKDVLKTKVIMKINKKNYIVDVDKDGNFSLKIKTRKVGSVIDVWGVVNENRGPLTRITVK